MTALTGVVDAEDGAEDGAEATGLGTTTGNRLALSPGEPAGALAPDFLEKHHHFEADLVAGAEAVASLK